MSSLAGTPGAAPEGPESGEALLEHVGIPHIITRRARWVTSRLRQR